MLSCAHAPDPLVTSGQSLHLAADEFVTTARLMDSLVTSHAVTWSQYEAWRAFGTRWQLAYPLAVDAWGIAVRTADVAAQQSAAATISAPAAHQA